MPEQVTDVTPPVSPGKTGWTPTASTMGGAVIGGALSQILVGAWNSFMPAHQIDVVSAGAVNTLCIFLVGYFFPDGGRR